MSISLEAAPKPSVKDFFQKPEVKKALKITAIALGLIGIVGGLIAAALLAPVAIPVGYIVAGAVIAGLSVATIALLIQLGKIGNALGKR